MFAGDETKSTNRAASTVKAVVTKDASHKFARSVETNNGFAIVPMTLEFKSTSRPLMQ